MRDDEHSQEFIRLMPELDAYCRAGMKSYVARADKAVVSDDIVQLAGMISYAYCNQPQYQQYEMSKLIWEVTKSLLSRFQRPPKKQKDVRDLGPKEQGKDTGFTALDEIIAREDLARLREFIKDDTTLFAIARREDGEEDCDIARDLGITQAALRKRISRLIAKVKARWPHRDDM